MMFPDDIIIFCASNSSPLLILYKSTNFRVCCDLCSCLSCYSSVRRYIMPIPTIATSSKREPPPRKVVTLQFVNASDIRQLKSTEQKRIVRSHVMFDYRRKEREKQAKRFAVEQVPTTPASYSQLSEPDALLLQDRSAQLPRECGMPFSKNHTQRALTRSAEPANEHFPHSCWQARHQTTFTVGLLATIGNGTDDVFNALPISGDSKLLSLVHHCKPYLPHFPSHSIIHSSAIYRVVGVSSLYSDHGKSRPVRR